MIDLNEYTYLTEDDVSDIIRKISLPDGVVYDMISDILLYQNGWLEKMIGEEDDPDVIKAFEETVDTVLDKIPKHYKIGEFEELKQEWIDAMQDIINEIYTDETIEEKEPLDEGTIERCLEAMSYIDHSNFGGKKTRMRPDIAERANELQRQYMYPHFKRVLLKPSLIENFIQYVKDRFDRCMALAGKRVGNIMASVFGESSTQDSLNTFHFAGVNNEVILGFPVFEQLISVAQTPSHLSCKVFTKENYNMEQMKIHSAELQYTAFKDLIHNYTIEEFDHKKDEIPYWEQIFDVLFNSNPENKKRGGRMAISKPAVFLSIKLHVKELFFRKITMDKIAEALESKSSDIRVVYSPINLGILYIYTENAYNDFDLIKAGIENSLYPTLLDVPISGIEGIKQIYVKNFPIKKAIKTSASTKVDEYFNIAFDESMINEWALSEDNLIGFVGNKLGPYFGLNTLNLSFENNVVSFPVPINTDIDIDDVIQKLRDASNIPIFNLTNRVSKSQKVIKIEFNEDKLMKYDVSITSIVDHLNRVFGSEVTRDNYIVSLTSNTSLEQINQVLKTETETAYGIETFSVRWYYHTDGSNLRELLSHKIVDNRHTISNSLIEIYQVLGKYPARKMLVRELAKNASKGINPVHIQLLADSIMYKSDGEKPLAQTRHGLRTRDEEFLAMAAFEETSRNLISAGFLGKDDSGTAFTARVLLGQMADEESDIMTEEEYIDIYRREKIFKIDFPEQIVENEPAKAKSQPRKKNEKPVNQFAISRKKRVKEPRPITGKGKEERK